MKKALFVAAALLVLSVAANAADIPDFKQGFHKVICKGNSEVVWENPDVPAFTPQNREVTVIITTIRDGWAVSGDFGFSIKRWSRNTKDGFPVGSASWDLDGLWEHWTMTFEDNGVVVFEKHSRRGVEIATLSCEYAPRVSSIQVPTGNEVRRLPVQPDLFPEG